VAHASDRPPPSRAREILEHYLANPLTADNLEGISEWRLLDDFVQRRVEETRTAVDWLVERGLLVKTTGRAIPPIYRLNRRAIARAERLIHEPEPPPGRAK